MCHKITLNYIEFEESILSYTKGLDVTSLTNNDNNNESKKKDLNSQLYQLDEELKDHKFKTQNLSESIATTNDERVRLQLEKHLSKILDTQEQLSLQRNKAYQELSFVEFADTDLETKLESLNNLYDHFAQCSPSDKFNIRFKIRQRLRELIKVIYLYPVGIEVVSEESIENDVQRITEVKPVKSKEDSRQLESLTKELRSKINNKDLRYFTVVFKSGSIRTIKPASPHQITLDVDKENNTVSRWDQEGKKFI